MFQMQWLKYINAYLRPANITFTSDSVVALSAKDYLNNVLDLYERSDKKLVT
jgi:hypothetical protein